MVIASQQRINDMAWNRQFLKFWIKDRRLLDRDVNDGRLDDTRIHAAINDALREVASRCGMLGEIRDLPLRAGQWEYPMPDDINDIRSVWFIDTNGTRIPVRYLSNAAFLSWRDPDDDTSIQPSFFTYPAFQGRVLSFRANAPPVLDFVEQSWVTTARIRTVQDSGINLGLTLEGIYVEPGMVVANITDGSIGYVEVVDITTNTSTGTATAGTNTNTLVDSTATFVADGVAVGDAICTPSTGVVSGYAFVTEVTSNTELAYAGFQSSGSALRFDVGDNYKVGKAQEIRLSEAPPHPGLRDGSSNTFAVGSTKATITGTTFTDTTVTGSATTGAESGDLAVASGGSHALVGGVDDNELTVDKWIGGTPSAGEEVTVKVCDKYQVQTDFRIERVLRIGPTPSNSDSIGSESLQILCNTEPRLPTQDDDPIELPRKFERPILACLRWKAAERAGDEDAKVDRFELRYDTIVRTYQGDIYRPPLDEPISAWGLRRRGNRFRDRRFQDSRGIAYDIDTAGTYL
jgi:hypothetical protein